MPINECHRWYRSFDFFGIIIGLIGFAGMGMNYPIYKKLLENGKNKYAFEIIELAKKISEEYNN